MNTFSMGESKYYCSKFSQMSGDSEKSIKDFQRSYLQNATILKEGTGLFNEYRDCSLRNIERLIFLSASNYFRSASLLASSSAPWAHVTLYYGSFFAANALLGLWGCTIFQKYIVEVDNGTCGHQRLRVRCIGTNRELAVKGGSHEQFWAIFYNTAAQIKPVILPEYRIALEPIQNSSSWLIEKRNQVNYDSYNGICSVVNFGNNFNATQFPQSLPGDLNVQFKTLKTLLNAVRHYAKEFGLSTDALYNIQNGCNWDNIINNHICLMTPPDISITY